MGKHSYKREAEDLRRKFATADATITKLVRDLREMDQLVYQMSQAGYPEQLRSAVQRAWAITEPRMRAESNRIAEILIPEIKKVYADAPSPQISSSGSSGLARSQDAGSPRVPDAKRIGKD